MTDSDELTIERLKEIDLGINTTREQWIRANYLELPEEWGPEDEMQLPENLRYGFDDPSVDHVGPAPVTLQD